MTNSSRCSPKLSTSWTSPSRALRSMTLNRGLQDQVFDDLMPSALDGSLPLDELLSDYFVRDLHTRMFGPVWNWAGR